MIGIIVFRAKYEELYTDAPDGIETKLGYSFGIGVLAGCLVGLASIPMSCSRQNQAQNSNVQPMTVKPQ